MDTAYRPEAWHDLYVMLGGAAAAFAGLLFVAISLHLNDILAVPYLRVFARNGIITMVNSITRAGIILVPQSLAFAATELIISHIFDLGLAAAVVAEHGKALPLSRQLRIGGIAFANLVGVAGALSLVAERGGGMFVITAAHFLYFCLIISAAWALMGGVYQSRPSPDA